jgi:hypothetical protein
MKKLIIVALLLSSLALFAQVPSYIWHIEPQPLSFSMYDYANGAYDGYPIRIQGDNIQNHGIYMTYMANQTAAVPRRQNYAFATLNGVIQAEGTITSNPITEGFGTLDIDPVSGNPLFAWHANYLGGTNELNVHFTYDIFSFSNTAGNAFADYATIIDNNESTEPGEDQHTYIWPVVHIGPSPTEGMRRIYVFSSNSGQAIQAIPSSSITLAYADFNADNIEMGMPSDFYWTTQRIPYFLDIHNWVPSNTDDTARAYPSYCVSEDGKVALAGFIDGNTTEWSGMEEHDAFVVLSEDYGETFTNIGLTLERELEPGIVPTIAANHPNNPTPGEDIPLYDLAENDNFAMRNGTLNHKTFAFDNFGKLHIPAYFYIGFTGAGDDAESNYWIPLSHVVSTVIFDPVTQTSVYNLINPKPATTITETLPMSYDLDYDGYIDDFAVIPNGADFQIDEWFEVQWPTVHFTTDNQFHYNQMRMTEFNEDGVAAMMWVDGTKAYLYNVNSDEDYAAYANAPEIKIIVTRDNGMTWSEPITMNALADSHPELGVVPSYVYPADKIYTITEGSSVYARLYFMYVDDKSFGAYTQSEGANLGAEVKYAALDIDITNMPVENDDIVTAIKPYGMLSQNYPNPFNPTTNIKFNTPKAGKVNLSIYNVKGQLVKTLVNDNFTAGEHTITWNGNDNNNDSVASGIYFYKLNANGKSEMKKMLLMK